MRLLPRRREDHCSHGEGANGCYIGSVLTDGATSEGKELYGLMLSRKTEDGSLRILLVDLDYRG